MKLLKVVKLVSTAIILGLNWPELDETDLSCTNDGGFGMISCDKESSCKCVDKMNQQIKEFTAPYAEKISMKCR